MPVFRVGRGPPRTNWRDIVKIDLQWLQFTSEETEAVAVDRQEWRWSVSGYDHETNKVACAIQIFSVLLTKNTLPATAGHTRLCLYSYTSPHRYVSTRLWNKQGGLDCTSIYHCINKNRKSSFQRAAHSIWLCSNTSWRRPTLTNCLSSCRSDHLTKTAESIEVLFVVKILGNPWYIVLDGGPTTPTSRGGGFSTAFAKLLWPVVSLLSGSSLWLLCMMCV